MTHLPQDGATKQWPQRGVNAPVTWINDAICIPFLSLRFRHSSVLTGFVLRVDESMKVCPHKDDPSHSVEG